MKLINYTISALALLGLTGIQILAQTSYEPYTFTALAEGGGSNIVEQIETAARFRTVNGVAVDSAGNLYVSDVFNHAIRKVTPEGVVTTLAGLPGTSGSADGSGSDARFNTPAKVAVDNIGNVYVTDDQNSTIRRVTPEGVVTTIAGRTASRALIRPTVSPWTARATSMLRIFTSARSGKVIRRRGFSIRASLPANSVSI
jgi:secreted PhoX family phosphatase